MEDIYIYGRKLVEGRSLTLAEWLSKLDDPTIYLDPNYAFPTNEMRDEYLDTIRGRSAHEVIDLIRRFLIPTCTPPIDAITPRAVSEIRTEQQRRVVRGGPAWEGLTWIIDLIQDSPQKAIYVLEAYADTHIQALDRGWWLQRLYDAIGLIRAKWIEEEHPAELLVSLGGHKFERLVASLFSEMGHTTSLTQASHDGGIDIRATFTANGQRYDAAIQCKCTQNNVGVSVVRELHAAVEDAKVSKGIIVCTQSFSPAARKWAKKNPRLELIDGPSLIRLLNSHLGPRWPRLIDYYTSLTRVMPGLPNTST
ncbi:restriction endonuclease [Sorangium sp. So ce131]|uniref:restriction endonuclease n=1 Tax=Sorangium sp. So ce131 TaxID=3133282 RepID=UPI003F5DD97F